MRTFVQNGMEDAAHIEKGDADSIEHDTGGLSGRKFVRTKGFHHGILGGRRGFTGKVKATIRFALCSWGPPRSGHGDLWAFAMTARMRTDAGIAGGQSYGEAPSGRTRTRAARP